MKCTNCGGEIDSQATVCLYCGSRNETGIAFYKEVYQRIQRNRLLAPILLRQKTPELVQRMLTRIIVAMAVLGMVLVGISLGMYLLMSEPVYSDAQPDEGSYAAEYVKVQSDYYNSDYLYWIRYSNMFLDALDEGRVPRRMDIEGMLDYGFRTYYADRMDTQLQEQARLQVDAMLQGVLELNEEELALFHRADEQYTYFMFPDPDAHELLVSLVEDKLAARLAEGWEE